jgi:drug/metabolite transporter (DMT)-like permease
MHRRTATLLLVIATFFWGMAFIAQKSAMDSMGPLTFLAARYLLGGVLILPFALREYAKRKRQITNRQWMIIGFLSLNFFLGSWLQQWGLATTSVTNGGFLTGLYVFFVPLILLIVFRTRPHPVVWLSAPVALSGLYLLSGASIDPFGRGDFLVIASAFFWGMQVLLLGYLAQKTGLPIFISALSFIAAGFVSLSGAFGLENISLEILGAGWMEILYTALFSTAIGFTLQAMGQQHVPPANAAIILSGESLFAALGGAIILGERLALPGYLGAAFLFTAIVLVETIPAINSRNSR